MAWLLEKIRWLLAALKEVGLPEQGGWWSSCSAGPVWVLWASKALHSERLKALKQKVTVRGSCLCFPRKGQRHWAHWAQSWLRNHTGGLWTAEGLSHKRIMLSWSGSQKGQKVQARGDSWRQAGPKWNGWLQEWVSHHCRYTGGTGQPLYQHARRRNEHWQKVEAGAL